MNIKFITKISEDLENIVSVTYNFIKIDSSSSTTFSKETLQSFLSKNINRFSVHDSTFNGCGKIEISILYSSGKTIKIKYTNIYELIWTPPNNSKLTPKNPLMRINTDSPYENTPENCQLVAAMANDLAAETEGMESDTVRGTKNLIYFTVYGGYYQLLKLCLESIHKKTPSKNFDVLIICDSNMRVKIETSAFIKNFNVHYHVVEKPIDGIAASKNKIKIFNWSGINDYKKVLFLDCDIIALKNVNSIFQREYESGKLYTIYNETLTDGALNAIYHSVTKASPQQMQFYKDNNQIAFNAGHFLFVNSLKMQSHFSNVLWFMNNYPGEHFFEQAFLAQYFCRNLLTIPNVLQNEFKIVILHNNKDLKKLHTDDTIFCHFAGEATEHVLKIEYIENYCSAYL